MIRRLNLYYRRIRNIIEDAKIIKYGFASLTKDGKTPEASYLAMRKLFVETRGKSIICFNLYTSTSIILVVLVVCENKKLVLEELFISYSILC